MFTGAKYARSGDVNIAYQVVGEGPIDLVLVLGWVSHLAYVWELPAMASFLNRLASFSRPFAAPTWAGDARGPTFRSLTCRTGSDGRVQVATWLARNEHLS